MCHTTKVFIITPKFLHSLFTSPQTLQPHIILTAVAVNKPLQLYISAIPNKHATAPDTQILTLSHFLQLLVMI